LLAQFAFDLDDLELDTQPNAHGDQAGDEHDVWESSGNEIHATLLVA
jgi:hypothetical protein